ncbi:MAG: permease-like cell division protein FtsX [Thermanaeromonas sp.]|uniref:permease-like cell division protein FtsX n=1 Tax=Thermanaeromonas sp. TaxID=2003697 RepID=UPI00243D3A97|nr:permease-like cell division protein FtsX [Thermanaeromonas sp.]MCG0277445.1 permease-like cell division protein FtsX [Thermanaeromonas sp.]
MRLRTWGYFFRQAFLSLWRNAWMSVAASTSVAVTLFILGAFILLVLNINFIALALQSNLEIAVFLRVDTPRSQALALKQQMESLPGVKEVELVPKEQGLKILAQQLGEEELLEATGGVNPLPDYLRVRVEDPARIGEVAAILQNLPAVEKVNYGQAVVERLLAVLRWVRYLGVGIIGMLAVASLMLLMITIRLAVYARRREINIMKYVGATDWFIRWPFLLEGLFIGLIGGGIAAGVLLWGYTSLTYKIKLSLFFLPLLEDNTVLHYTALGLVGGGACVGAVGSLLAIHRFLKV